MSWTMTDTPAAVHILPEDDIILHTESLHCTCVPVVEEQGSTCHGHGPMGTCTVRQVVTHQAMDGRPDE